MTRPATTRDVTGADQRGRLVFCARPRCPECGSTRLKSYKTVQNGDDTVTRYTSCRDCLCKFRLCVE